LGTAACLMPTDANSLLGQQSHALDQSPCPGEHHIAMRRRFVISQAAREATVRTGDGDEREWTNIPVGWIERRAVTIEGLPEVVGVEGRIAQARDERGDDLRCDPAGVVLEEPEESPALQ
jgi:hypothetical protein